MWFNLIGFNVAWLGLVVIGNSFVPVALLLLVLHVTYCMKQRAELILILLVASIGVLLDSALTHLGIFIFREAYYIPLWLMVLWFCFAATLAHSLFFLSSSHWLQLGAGALFAPLSYLAGANFNAVNFGYSVFLTYVILAVLWAPLMVLFFQLAHKLNINKVSHA